MMRLTFVVAAAMLCTASSAHAHAFLERALPPVGSETATPPRQIVLTFTEGVEPLFSTIEAARRRARRWRPASRTRNR